MTRMVVAREGDDNPVNGFVIVPGALYVNDDILPVVWDGGVHRIIGKASGFERHGNEVSMEIELAEGIYMDLEDGIEAYVFVQPFEVESHPTMKYAVHKVLTGRVREISLRDRISPLDKWVEK